MRILLILLPLLSWGVIPQLEMDRLAKQYLDSNQSLIKPYSYNNNNYYIVHSIEEKLFPDDTLEEEKKYLKAGIQQALYKYMKQQYPKMVSMQLSGLLHGAFWEDKHYYHHVAQIEKELFKPLYKKTVTFKHESNSSKDPSSHTKSNMVFTMPNEIHKIQQEKIETLEKKSKKDPLNFKLLDALGKLYKELGDVEGYTSVTERIMDAMMAI